MLRYFPVACNDELLYSQIARYHVHSCSPGFKQTIEELFGSRTVAAVVDLPAHLKQLHQHTHHITRQSLDNILLRQTLYPLYAPFLEPDLATMAKASMLSDYGGDIHTRAGIAASRIKRMTLLRVCPACHKEQLLRNGEAYWQRLFQVSGVVVCPVHRLPLQSTVIPYVPYNKHQFAPVPQQLTEQAHPVFSASVTDKLVVIARDIQLLLDSKFPSLSHAQWTTRYSQLLSQKGLLKGKNVNQHDLHEGFTHFWGSNVLKTLSCEVNPKDEHSWLTAMVRKHRKNNHPLLHILLYRYLAGVNAPLSDLFSPCSTPINIAIPQKSTGKNLTDLEENKARWLELQKEHPGDSAKQLRLHSPALYARLYRQDRDWLQKNTPHQKRIARVNNRVDWQQRDQTIARSIIRQAKKYQHNEASPRISKKLLAQSAGYLSSIEKHLKLLPITEQVLNTYSESITEYQCRRIDRAVATLKKDNEPILSWKIYRKANIRADVPQEVKEYIQKKTDESVQTSQI